ncbi:MAG: hypothetical protein LIP11_04145 [Clostridiales bacterium]|nr:hypothetical protein [Clostridiales bacterium]
MIGKAYVSVTPYYDSNTCKRSFKKRPVLIIGKADETDYVVLPISRVTRREYLDASFDISMEPQDYPLMNLSAISYIRTHKQFTVREESLTKCTTDFKENYPDTYILALERMEEFQKLLIDQAL